MASEKDLSVSITAIDSVSALGTGSNCWGSFSSENHLLKQTKIGRESVWSGNIPEKLIDEILQLKHENSNYGKLDLSVLQAIWICRQLVDQAGWGSKNVFGTNIGSSRGATALFEKYYKDFLDHSRVSSLASPTTTLGNISSWVAQDLGSAGPELSHSITCSTSLHALLNGIAWLEAGFSSKFLVGGSESPLTPFTIAQMQALKIYSSYGDSYPCKALDLKKQKNSMVLGEGAAMACLEKGEKENALAIIRGIGYATEKLAHPASFSTHGDCLQRSMAMACKGVDLGEVDIVVMHAPGTKKGDQSEYRAIERVFGSRIPALTTNKWKIGHTLGSSGMINLQMAVLMLQKQEFVGVPFVAQMNAPKEIENILVNAVGFGGNAVSVLVKRN
ncbi:MAG: beta-ketoacyl synthase N-terminal-like domain-containing protein [Flavobacteriaceae bacterium]